MGKITALYFRLSVDDDNRDESNSMRSQWEMLHRFVAAHSFLAKTEIAEFSDDGHTGTSFDRSAMKALLEKAKRGEFGCILVKDTSRFGSNYIEISEYLEKIFPFLGVRFISVNDGYDSEDYKGQTTPMNIAFGSIMHNIYSRDLSLKVTQSNISKAKKGEFFCGVVPFGFMKSKTVKNKLEIDEKAAQTMRKIFSLACENYSTGEIAALLNAEHVPTPLAYRKQNGLKPAGNHAAVYERWVSDMVRRILRDERYIGIQVGGKRKSAHVGSHKTIAVPPEDWIRVPDAHERIVSDEVFQEVGKKIEARNHTKHKKPVATLYSGKIKCGHCGKSNAVIAENHCST